MVEEKPLASLLLVFDAVLEDLLVLWSEWGLLP